MSKVYEIVLVIGMILIGGALLLMIRPEMGVPGVLEGLGSTSTVALTILVVVIVGLFGLFSFRASGMEDDAVSVPEIDPEGVKDDGRKVLRVEWEDSEEARRSLASTVEEILVNEHDYEPAEASEAVTTGSWTRDRVAAAVIDTGVTYPVLERLRGWLEDDGTVERRLSRAMLSIEELHERGEEG